MEKADVLNVSSENDDEFNSSLEKADALNVSSENEDEFSSSLEKEDVFNISLRMKIYSIGVWRRVIYQRAVGRPIWQTAREMSLFVGCVLVYLRDGSAQSILRVATLR